MQVFGDDLKPQESNHITASMAALLTHAEQLSAAQSGSQPVFISGQGQTSDAAFKSMPAAERHLQRDWQSADTPEKTQQSMAERVDEESSRAIKILLDMYPSAKSAQPEAPRWGNQIMCTRSGITAGSRR